MQEYPGLLIGQVRRRVKQVVLGLAAPYRVSPQQFWMLVALRSWPGVSQAELVEKLQMDAPTGSRVLTALTRRDLVRLELDPRDRRRASIRLTEAGEAMARELERIAASLRTAVVDGISEAEQVRLRQTLRKILSNLDAFQARGAKRRSS
jgi:DNA-binding MarR family transcriptional regulator